MRAHSVQVLLDRSANQCVADHVTVVMHRRLEWPVRAVSFSFDGRLLASASEDLFIDIADVETGKRVSGST